MSPYFAGICILWAALGGPIVLILYSLLVKPLEYDPYMDQLELEMLKSYQGASSRH